MCEEEQEQGERKRESRRAYARKGRGKERTGGGMCT